MTRLPARRRPAPCCPPTQQEAPSRRHVARVALVGNPNVGKSTLFNALTGARQHVGNWPGKTVHVARGTWVVEGRPLELVDLPGTYSLLPRSPDEELTRDLLVDRGLSDRPDVVVVLADAANLARNLYLIAQVLDTGVPLVVALTMLDVARGRGVAIDVTALARALTVPVVEVSPRARQGLDRLAAAVARVLRSADCAVGRAASPVDLGGQVEEAVRRLTAALATHPRARTLSGRWLALELLAGGEGGELLAGATGEDLRRRLAQARELVTEEEAPIEVGEAPDVETVVAERRYAWVHRVVTAAVRHADPHITTWSDRVDRVLTSAWVGPVVFLLVMWGVFVVTTRLTAPLQEGLAALLDGPVRDGVGAALSALGVRHGWPGGLVLDGVVAGVGQLLTFVPLMTVMFVLLAVLEDSGYLARAAFVVDRLMRVIGLPGRAFLPLIVGFGCNVPAVAGTRILTDARHRLVTALLVPYVTCSARLAVYVLMAGIFFGGSAGTVIFAMYLLSVALVVLVGLLLRRTVFRRMAREALVLELPPYRLPTPRVVAAQTWQRLSGFLRTAGGIIVATVTVVWLLSAIPLGGGGFGRVPVEHSVYGGVSRAVAPVLTPAGFGDWTTASALATGFVAKEAVVSTFAQTYSAQRPSDLHQAGELGTRLRETFTRTSGGHPLPAVLAFLVFLLAYTPCLATVAAQRAEVGLRPALSGMVGQLVVAWVLAVTVFQVGRLLW